MIARPHRVLFFLILVTFYACDSKLGAQQAEIPFRPGETLVYEVRWSPPKWLLILPGTYYAGDITLKVEEKLYYQTNQAYKFTLLIKSSGILPKIAGLKIEDHIESIADAQEFCSYVVKKQIREGRRLKDVTIIFYRSDHKIQVKEMDVSREPHQLRRNEFIPKIPSCVQDLLSILYAIRLRKLESRQSYRVNLSDEGKVKEVEIKILDPEKISMPEGVIQTAKIQALGLFEGLFKAKGEFYLWLSNDEKKAPVRFEAKVKYGKIQGYLKGAGLRNRSSLAPARAPSHRPLWGEKILGLILYCSFLLGFR